MAQPIEQLYLRALRALGIVTPGGVRLALAQEIQPVQILGDFSDFARPHSNPVFGCETPQAAVVGEYGCIELHAIGRAVRVRQINVTPGTQVRMEVRATSACIDTGPVLVTPGSLGPVPSDTPTATIGRGAAAAYQLPGQSFRPDMSPWRFAPALLVQPGSYLAFMEATLNTIITVGIEWEEIPREGETDNQGFPTGS